MVILSGWLDCAFKAQTSPEFATACTAARGTRQGYWAHVTVGEIEAEIWQAGVHPAAAKLTGRLLRECSRSACKSCNWITLNHLLSSSQLKLLFWKFSCFHCGTFMRPGPSMRVLTAATSPNGHLQELLQVLPTSLLQGGQLCCFPLVPTQRDATHHHAVWRLFQSGFQACWVLC